MPLTIRVLHEIRLDPKLSIQLDKLIEALSQDGLSPEDSAALAELVIEGERVTLKAEALNAQQ
jgi:hypothetical protein